MHFVFSKHALEQMGEREISSEDVTRILLHPVEVMTEQGFTVYHGFSIQNRKRYLIRIFVNEHANPKKIITVYRTSKIRKYYEGEI